MTGALAAPAKPAIMLVAGEPSGDALGAQLMERLRERAGSSVRLIGVGGSEMRARGLQSLFPIDDIAHMGLRDVIPRIPQIWSRIRQVADFLTTEKPRAAVLIDSSDFMRRVAVRVKSRPVETKLIKYVAPQVWASRPGRAKAMARTFDHMLCLFPFEAPFFRESGLPATFVGHPVIERAPAPGLAERFRAVHGISQDEKVLVLLPGSRMSEIRFLWPVFRDAVDILSRSFPGLRVVLPTVPTVAQPVRDAVAAWQRPVILVEDGREKWGAFEAGTVALAASGTVATELALAGTPMVIGYKVGWLTAAIARRLIRVDHFTLLNIVLGRRDVPELIQEECTAENLARELSSLLSSPGARARQMASVGEALKQLGQGSESPSMRAAQAVLTIAGL